MLELSHGTFCRNLKDKIKEQDFVNYITQFDIICVYECWVSEGGNIDIDGYNYINCPRSRCKGVGGVYYKLSLEYKIKLQSKKYTRQHCMVTN